MLRHVELCVRDPERSILFWKPFMSLLGHLVQEHLDPFPRGA